MTMQTRQKGGSAIGLIIFLAVIGYGVFVGIQYVPQYIESNTVTAILNSIVDKNHKEPLDSMRAVQREIDNQLLINELRDLKSNFKVKQYRGDFIITVSYERELNLLYATKQIPFEKTVTLN